MEWVVEHQTSLLIFFIYLLAGMLWATIVDNAFKNETEVEITTPAWFLIASLWPVHVGWSTYCALTEDDDCD